MTMSLFDSVNTMPHMVGGVPLRPSRVSSLTSLRAVTTLFLGVVFLSTFQVANAQGCGMGQYFASNGITCIDCLPGTNSLAINATSSLTCALCPLGTFSLAGSTNCTDCQAGTFGDIPGNCANCIGGTFSASTAATSSATCIACPAGSYSTGGASICTPCPQGSYSVLTGGNALSSCLACPPGTSSAATGANTAATCAPCATNSFSYAGAGATCSSCPAGFTLISPTLGCAPTTVGGTTSSLFFYLQGSQAAGVEALGVVNNAPGITYTMDRMLNLNGALNLASGAYLGTGAYTLIPSAMPRGSTTAMSVAAWVKCPNSTNPAFVASVVEWGSPTGTSMSPLKFGLSVGSSPMAYFPGPISNVCDGTWHHLALTYDPSIFTLRQYVDGVTRNTLVTASGAPLFNLPITGSSLRVGYGGGMTAVAFTNTGVGTWTVPADVTSINVIVVAGGGGGGGTADRTAGGGGGGGVLCLTLPVTPGQIFNLNIGNGGNGGGTSGTAGSAGGSSSFGAFTVAGGGGGGGSAGIAGSGGSGGGIYHGGGTAGSGTSGQGFAGSGTAYNSGVATGTFTASGGGGAGSLGLPGTITGGGNGGNGKQCPLIAAAYFGGGGGGVAQSMGTQNLPAGAGGAGGGGAGAKQTGTPTTTNGNAAKPNSGGGGGGGYNGGAGGSGIIMVSYATPVSTTDVFTGSMSEVRLYSRALTQAEVEALSQPPIALPSAVNPTPVVGSNSYSWSSCAAGYAGTISLAMSRNTTNNEWATTGTNGCVACAPGTYSTTSGSATCTGTACTLGRFGPSATTSATAATCTIAPAGTFAAAGAVTASYCVPGTYSTASGSSSCTGTPCAAGSSSPSGATSVGAAACIPCAAGFYQPLGSQSSCISCPPGTASAGTSQTSATTCASCTGSTYSYGGIGACASCPAGTTFVSTQQGCAPNRDVAPGPSDTGMSFFMLGSNAEGTSAFSSITNPGGVTYGVDRLSNTNAALTLASNSYISTASYAAAPAFSPFGNPSASISAWIRCNAFTTSAQSSVLEWGQTGVAAVSNTKLGLSVLGSGSAALPGPIGAVCDSNWHHLVLANDATTSTLRQYVDGVNTNTITTSSYSIPAVANTVRLGWNGGVATQSITATGSSTWIVPADVTSINVIIVGGGGGGGGTADRSAGGGGGGGVLCVNGLTVVPGQPFAITVGAGGAGGGTTGTAGSAGGSSSFGTLTALGGGGGGGSVGGVSGSGSSGGGIFHGGGTAGSGTAGQGFAGGATAYNSGSATGTFTASGGGGAGAAGGLGTSASGGNGGIGKQCLFFATTYYGGGGGGAAQSMATQNLPAGAGGAGGGGAGAKQTGNPLTTNGNAGVANTGGGGGGGYNGGAGGSGIIIITWASPAGANTDAYAGSISDMRIYNRALTLTEVVSLSQPPLGLVAAINPVPIAGSTSYTWNACAPGYYGTSTYALTRGANNIWSSSGTVSCTLCPAGQYSYPGATSTAACASCPPVAPLASQAAGCAPTSSGSLDGLVFYHSTTSTEGTAAFATVVSSGGITYTTDRVGAANSAMSFASGSYIGTNTAFPHASTYPLNNAPMTISTWVRCAPFTSPFVSSVFEWGNPGFYSSLAKFAITIQGNLPVACPGGVSASLPGPFGGVCDNNWHHLALTQGDGSSTTLKQYTDGVLTGMVTNNTFAIPAIGNSVRVAWNGGVATQIFTATGTTTWTVPAGVTLVSALVVGGGGGGGGTADRTAGGGGGGGVLCSSNIAVTPGQVITVTVGTGGNGGGITGAAGSAGGSSVFGTLTALGGGGGGGSAGIAGSGGSGGGIYHGGGTAGGGTANQGFGGGTAVYNSGSATGTFTASGGGGAGSLGLPGTITGGGNGGNGRQCSFAGFGFYGGGGGGVAQSMTTQNLPAGVGGIGGGGAGAKHTGSNPTTTNGVAAVANTGGGGGGGYNGGAGGSGTVMLVWSSPSTPSELFAGSVDDMRLYNRALIQSEIEALSQPPLPQYSYALNPTPVVGSNSYTWTCAAGYFGTSTLALTRNVLTNVWTQSGAISCNPCSLGIFCPAGTTVNTQICPPGYFCPGSGFPPQTCASGSGTADFRSIVKSACNLCGPGNFSIPGFPCAPCQPGTYSNATGASSCLSCPPGTFNAQSGSISISSCFNCPAGYWSNSIGAISASSCVMCAPGIACPEASISSGNPCPAGSYCPGGGVGPLLCPPGTASKTTGSTQCTQCIAGAWATGFGNSICTACPAGSYSTEIGATSNKCISSPTTLSALAWTKVPPPSASLTGKGAGAAVANGTTAIFLGGNTGITGTAISQAPYPARLVYDISGPNGLFEVPDTATGAGRFRVDRAATTTTPDGRLWAFGGVNANGVEINTMAFFTPSFGGQGVWTTLPTPSPAPSPRKLAAMTYLSNCTDGTAYPFQCFVLFGGDFAVSSTAITRFGDVWVYFPDYNMWMQPPEAQSSASGAMPPPITAAAISASVDGRAVYIFGGNTASGATAQMYVLDPSGTFFSTPLPLEMNNTARGRYANMSTVYKITGTNVCSPSFATDGSIPVVLSNALGNCQMAGTRAITTGTLGLTGGEFNPWFYVDLGVRTSFDALGIFTRSPSDMGPSKFSGFQIWFGDSAVFPTLTTPPGNGANTLCPNLPADLAYPSNIVYCKGAGRYVWLYLPPINVASQFIFLSEFQVLRRTSWIWRQLSGFTNVALMANAFASSVYFNGAQAGDPMYATDGQLYNNWPFVAGTTDRMTKPYPDCNNVHITIDLGSAYLVQALAVWPRTDCCRVRSRRMEMYVGNSRDWRYNTRVLTNLDLEAPTAGQGTFYPLTCPAAYGTTATSTSCWANNLATAAAGRYVTLRKMPFNPLDCSLVDTGTYTSLTGGAGTGQDQNAMNIAEIQVYAQKLLNQPTPRSHMAYTSYRGTMVIYGGIDRSGFYSADIQMFDLIDNAWGAVLQPLGTPPSSRTQASLLGLPNPLSLGVYSYPSTALALANGFDSSGSPIGDLNLLSLPICAPSPFLSLTSVYMGIASESCNTAGTVCSYTCASGFAPAPANGPRNTVVCSPTGDWVGSLPVCIPVDPIPTPSIAGSSVSLLGFNGARITWSAPTTGGVWPIIGYRVSVDPVDFVENFVNIDSRGKSIFGFPTPSAWSLAPTDQPTNSFYYFDTVSGALVLNNMQGSGTNPYNNINLLRTFPTAETKLNPDGDFVIETYLWLDTSTANQVTSSQNIGLCAYDTGYARTWTTGLGINGTCQFYAGLRVSGGILQYGWESIFASASGPSYTATGWNNWFAAPQGNAWVRLERRGLQGASPSLGGSWRVAFKFQAAGSWLYMPNTGIDSRLAGGKFTAPLATFMRIGLIARTWSTTVNFRLYGYFKYLRVAPLRNCNTPGSTRVLANASTLTADIVGLNANLPYSFRVQAIAPAGVLSAPVSIPGSITTATYLTTNWAANLPSLYANNILVDALTFTSYTKTTYAVSVWNNDVGNFGPQRVIDGLLDTGANGFAQAGNAGGGYWLPSGPLADRTLASSFTGTSYIAGVSTNTQTSAFPSVDPMGDWWAVDLGIRTAVKVLFISGRQSTCCIGRTTNAEIWIGDAAPPYWNQTRRCDPALMPVSSLNSGTASVTDPKTGIRAAYSGFFQCPLAGRYVYMRAPGIGGTVTGFGAGSMDGQFNVAEIRVYASNLCPARTATNALTNTPAACSGTNVTGGSVYGAVCVQTCLPGFTLVSGSGIANCDGDNWDQAPMVCSPSCPVLSAPALMGDCTQTLFQDTFTSPLSLNNWYSTQPDLQGIGSTWFAPDGALEATNNLGCNDQMTLLPQSVKLAQYVGDFTVSATVSPQGSTQVGVVFFSNPSGTNYTRFVLDASGLGVHTLDRVVNGIVTRITDTNAITVLPFSTHTISIKYIAATGLINVTVNNVLVISTNDRTFKTGAPGVFAATNALFYRFAFGIPCLSGCVNAMNGEICTFTCHPGLLPTGPTARTCDANAGAWVPDVVANPLICTVPPPTFFSTTLSISEDAAKNAPVGQPLVGYSSAPDYQIQWAIVSETPSDPNVGSLFFIDLCSGQVKLRQSGGMDFVAWTPVYTLLVRASIAGFVGTSDTVRNITVRVIQVDTPPRVQDVTQLTIAENSAFLAFSPFTVVGNPQVWDRENSTLTPWLITADTSNGLFAMNNNTGNITLTAAGGCAMKNTSNVCSSSRLDFEAGTVFTLQISVRQEVYCCGTSPFAASTGAVVITIMDENDAPEVNPFQLLRILNTVAVAGARIGDVFATDQDSITSPFYSETNYSLVPPYVQASYPSCMPSASLTGGLPTTDGTVSGTPLFDIAPSANLNVTTAASLSFSSTVSMPIWASKQAFSAYGFIARALFTLCVNTSDSFGAWSIGPITVAVEADMLNTPVISAWNAPSTGISTLGGETIVFNGTGFSAGIISLTATYKNDQGNDFNATNCVVVSSVMVSCKTAPGVGANVMWSVFADGVLIPSIASLSTFYQPPVITSVSANAGSLKTDGFTSDGFSIVFTGVPGTFPPSSLFPVTINYGNSFEYSCNVLVNPADSNTTARCSTVPGYGANLPWSLTVGGQTTYSSAYAFPVFSYLRPSVFNLVPQFTVNPFTLTTLDTAGNQRVLVNGSNFGDNSANTVVSFGGPQGTLVTLSCPHVTSSPHTQLLCTTPAGLGTGHNIQIVLAGQSLVTPFAGFAYLPPVITRVSGAGQVAGPTDGGAVLVIDGLQFGPLSGILGMSGADVISYGHFPYDINRYTARGCRVTASPDSTGGSTWTMTCTTTEGVGSGLGIVMTLGGQYSPIYQANISYGSPQITSFRGPGAFDADTAGGQSVIITGVNLGPGPSNPLYVSYFSTLLQVQYGVTLVAGPFPELDFTNTVCSVSVPHTELTCATEPGAGHNLVWHIILDGLHSSMPTTAYAPPIITSITDVTGASTISDANVNGGTLLYVRGSFFGPFINGVPLVQHVTYGPTGAEIDLSPSSYNVSSQSLIIVRLPPGSGQNLRMTVAVADQLSLVSTASFSYAPPSIIGVYPNTAHTSSNPRSPTFVTIVANNLPLLDPLSSIGILLGNDPYAIARPPVLPTGAVSVAQATNIDGSVNISFPLPNAGSGVNLGVRITITPVRSTSASFITPIVYMPGTASEFDASFSYETPEIDAIIVSRARFLLPPVMGGPTAAADIATAKAQGAVPCPFPYDPVTGAQSGTWSCKDLNLKLIEIIGVDFGLYGSTLPDPASTPIDHSDGVTKSLDLLIYNDTGTSNLFGEVWSTNPAYLYSWSHTRIAFYSSQFEGVLRLSQSNVGWDGVTQTSVIKQAFFNQNPEISNLNGNPVDIPTTGGDPTGVQNGVGVLELTLLNLVGVRVLDIKVGPYRVNATSIIDPATSIAFTSDAAVATWLNTFPSGNSIVVRFIAPPGQGQYLPIQIVNNQLSGTPSASNTGFTLSYAAPVITFVSTVRVSNGQTYSPPEAVPATFSFTTPVPTVTVPTDGSIKVRIYGTNLGLNPVITLADQYRLFGNGVVAPCPASALGATGTPSNGFPQGHTCYEVAAPEGEGSGSLFPDSFPRGYYLVEIEAGNSVDGSADPSAQVSGQVVRFAYETSSVTSVVSSVAGAGKPTSGGVAMIVTGSNFGAPRIGRPDSIVNVEFFVPGVGSSFACLDVARISHTEIKCTLPDGSGKALSVSTNIADVVGVTANMLDYDPPVLTNVTVIPANSWSTAVGSNSSADSATYITSGVTVNSFAALVGAISSGIFGSPRTPLFKASAAGADIMVLTGNNFGRLDSTAHCAFLAWTFRSDDAAYPVPSCDGFENFLGEGEVAASRVLYWSHSVVAFLIPAGLGTKDIELSIRGNRLTTSIPRSDSRTVRFRYDSPSPASLRIGSVPSNIGANGIPQTDTEGGEVSVLSGLNFGPTPRNTSNPSYFLASENGFSVSLNEAPGLPTAYLVLTFHRACVTTANTVRGLAADVAFHPWYAATPSTVASIKECTTSFLSIKDDEIRFLSLPGIGAGREAVLHVIEPTTRYTGAATVLPFVSDAETSSSPLGGAAIDIARNVSIVFSYKPPSIDHYDPRTLKLAPYTDPATGSIVPTNLDIYGRNFGDYASSITQAWTDVEGMKKGYIGGYSCVGDLARNSQDGDTFLTCSVPSDAVPVGYRNVTLMIAGQTGYAPEYYMQVPNEYGGRPTTFAPLLIACGIGFYGRINETCLPCPAQYPDTPALTGAYCGGYSETIAPFESRFLYPRPLKGWYNLNSSDSYSKGVSMMDICPEGFQDHGRDVCLVPCDPRDSCLGDNHCAYGYTSKAPNWRCASCDTGFYKRAGECIKCPDSPAGLFIGFALLVIVVAIVGFMLNKKQVNIAVISIGVDFFQVLAIFSQSRIKWPPVVKELFHVLSAFNLNIEIVAPECLIPDVSYKAKFYFIMLLPLSVGSLLLFVFAGLTFNKAIIKGRPKKKWFTHKPSLISSGLVLMYMLYLYLTRTVLDVFNCTPTVPPDGYTYLSVADNERCGVPGGTQMTLLVPAIAGLAVYTAGYPSLIGYMLWKNRELVMEDQLLRAKGAGSDRLSNPHAYEFRKMFGRSYFQFKPDNCLWILAIILRKFFIALTSVIFNKNASFQMAACLLVVFVAYAAQMSVFPYLSPGDYDEVLRAHNEASLTNILHARLKTAIANIETRGRKKVRKNLLNFEGKVDRAAIFGILTGWLFNYNTVEQLMLFAAVIVCLMGIMYQSTESTSESYYPGSRDSVTGVVLAVIIVAIVYFFIVVITEIVVMYNEDSRAKQMAKAARAGRGGAGSGKKIVGGGSIESGTAGSGKGRLVSDEGEINTGKLDSQMNPMFMSDDGRTTAASNLGIEAILNQKTPPSAELWMAIQSGYVDVNRQLEASNNALAAAKKELQLVKSGMGGSSSGNGDDGEEDTTNAPATSKTARKSFAPRGAEGTMSTSNPLRRGASGRNAGAGGAGGLAGLRGASSRKSADAE